MILPKYDLVKRIFCKLEKGKKPLSNEANVLFPKSNKC